MNKKISYLATKIVDCFFLLRITLLAPVWTILLVGWITGNKNARPFAWFSCSSNSGTHPLYLWIALAGFSLIVASIYVVNQIVDIESDRINHKLFLLPHGYLSVRTAWVLAGLCMAGGMASALFFDWPMAVLYLAGLILGIFYNLPPLKLKNRAWGGVIANILGHGVLTFIVGWYSAHFPNMHGFEIIKNGLVSSLSPGMANAAVFLATTIPDATGDRMTNKKTFCVTYGEKRTALAATCFCTFSLVLSFFMAHNFWVMALPALVSVVLFIALAAATNKKAAFHAFKWPVFLLTVFVMLFIPQYGVLIVLTFFGSRLYYQWRFGIMYPTFQTK
jgi:4-hydroxybenzoate polyprenyltransferase and related prenyltransferases